MTLNAVLEEMRLLFYEPRTLRAWERLCALLDRCPPERAFIAVDYAEEHMRTWGWPDHLRIAPQAWLEALFAQGRDPRMRLVRVAAVDDRPRLSLDDVAALSRCDELDRLLSLDLRYREVCSEGVALLARAPLMTCLRRLDLGFNRVDDEGAVALAEAACPLTDLDLRYNRVGTEGLIALLDSPVFERVERLELEGNNLDDRAVDALVLRAGRLPALKVLGLAGNPISPGSSGSLQRAFSATPGFRCSAP